MPISPQVHTVIMVIIGALELGLAAYFLLRYIKNSSILWYITFVVGVAGFVLFNAITYFSSPTPLIYDQLQWFSGVVITAAFFMFIQEFPVRLQQKANIENLLFWVPVTLFAVIIFLGNDFITGHDATHIPALQHFGGTFVTFPVFFVLYWAFSMRTIAKKMKKTDGVHHKLLKQLLLYGVVPPLVLSTISDVLLTPLGIQGYGWIGPESSILWLGFSSYTVLRK